MLANKNKFMKSSFKKKSITSAIFTSLEMKPAILKTQIQPINSNVARTKLFK